MYTLLISFWSGDDEKSVEACNNGLIRESDSELSDKDREFVIEVAHAMVAAWHRDEGLPVLFPKWRETHEVIWNELEFDPDEY